MEDNMLKKAFVFATKHGYDTVRKTNVEYKGYKVFEPRMKKRGGKVAKIGYPLLILANESEMRLSTIDECLEINDMIYPNVEESEW